MSGAPVPKGKPKTKARRKPMRWKSEKRAAEAEAEEAVRQVVFRRDGHRCVLDKFAGTAVYEWVTLDSTVGPRLITYEIPACSGRLEFGHRRKASAGGAYVPANGWATCSAHNQWVENQPDAARAVGGETPWWLCVREGDPDWDQLGRRANR